MLVLFIAADSGNCLFLLTISPDIEPVCGKMCDQIISSAIRDNLTTHFETNRFNITRYREQKLTINGNSYERDLFFALVYMFAGISINTGQLVVLKHFIYHHSNMYRNNKQHTQEYFL